MTQEVIALKLSSGEEIVARVEGVDNDKYTLDRPQMLGVARAEDGSLVIQMVPWLASNQDGNCVVYKTHVVAEIEPHAELEKGYLSKTSGIQLA